MAIEINADIGEGWDDARLLPYVERASIACGGHAGDAASMAQALRLCARYAVKAGAHPGYPDRENFGRRPLPAAPEAISRWVAEQVGGLAEIANGLGIELFHVKPHGALYNLAAADEAVGGALLEAMGRLPGLALIVLAGSPLAAQARACGVAVLEEAFADRRYLADGRLAPRRMPGAVIESAPEAAAQAQALARGAPLATLDGGRLVLRADTLCLHGDLENAETYARAVREALRGM